MCTSGCVLGRGFFPKYYVPNTFGEGLGKVCVPLAVFWVGITCYAGRGERREKEKEGEKRKIERKKKGMGKKEDREKKKKEGEEQH